VTSVATANATEAVSSVIVGDSVDPAKGGRGLETTDPDVIPCRVVAHAMDKRVMTASAPDLRLTLLWLALSGWQCYNARAGCDPWCVTPRPIGPRVAKAKGARLRWMPRSLSEDMPRGTGCLLALPDPAPRTGSNLRTAHSNQRTCTCPDRWGCEKVSQQIAVGDRVG